MKQLLTPFESTVACADNPPVEPGRCMNISPLSSHPHFHALTEAAVFSLGFFCCMMGCVQLFHLGGLEECCGCTPLSVGQWSEERYQSSIEQGAVPALRVMSHWAEQGWGHWACHMADGWFTTSVERWGIIGHISLPSARTHTRTPARTHAYADATSTHDSLTDNPCSFQCWRVLAAFKNCLAES